jgi:excisionase family DNA binding protein
MSLAKKDEENTWAPEEVEKIQAKEVSDALSELYQEIVEKHEGDSREFLRRLMETDIQIPPRAIAWMLKSLQEVASGNAIRLMPVQSELTTQQAGDFLNISRPFLISLLEKGEIKHRKVGKHRRVLLSDLYEYKLRSDQEREEALRRMTERSQTLESDHFNLKDLER